MLRHLVCTHRSFALGRYEWDEEIGGKGTVIVDPIDGLYKAWYISQPGIDYLTYNSTEGRARMISYAYSKVPLAVCQLHCLRCLIGTVVVVARTEWNG
jgi:hypothetical protein